ncbi:putative cobalt-precorrin-6B C(15)-methyltransferase (decarboxylating) [uncultured archaeon]|nr:putative cobalt-precorrin-6B C(15)-methyltransferase (decarboxylating) [uncultured archaeon]
MSRAPKQQIIFQEKLNIPKEFIRFATPKDVANYRAEKLKCSVLVELGAGIGGQTIAFSRRCKKVIAVEKDKNRARILNQNLKKLRIKNVEVINGDALNKSIIQKISKEKVDIVFFDTERPEETDRTLSQIQPPVDKIIEFYSPLTKKIAIEIPPFTQDIETLKKDYNFESEFLSLNSQLNRLTLYFNELKTCGKSVVALPSKEKLTNSEKAIKSKRVISAENFKNFRYLYSIDPAVVVSDLTNELAEKFNASILELNKPVLLSNSLFKSYFLIPYEIIKICSSRQEEILKELKEIGAGKVTLRYNIPPEDYWNVRKFYESRLNGKKEVSLFINEKQKEAIICKKT